VPEKLRITFSQILLHGSHFREKRLEEGICRLRDSENGLGIVDRIVEMVIGSPKTV